MTPDHALAVLLSGKLSCRHREVVRSSVKDRFPSYKIVKGAKKKCYPSNLAVTETVAVNPL